MNSQSGKFCAPILGKLLAFPRMRAWPLRIGEVVNFQHDKLSDLKIEKVAAFQVGNLELCASGQSRRQGGDWLRSEFPALKIETVENGSIRQ